MIDALGFKGMWERNGIDRVLAKMHSLKNGAEASVDMHDSFYTPRAIFLSDMLVVGFQAKAVAMASGPRDALLVFHAAARAVWMIEGALQQEPRFAYRGCITFGGFELDDPFIIGPAIDEAAESCEKAEGAFVWLTPSALAVWEDFPLALQHQHACLTPCCVPLKDGTSRETQAVSPLDPLHEPTRRKATATALLSTFDVGRDAMSPSVRTKKQNTAAFLDTLMAEDGLRVDRAPATAPARRVIRPRPA